MDNLNILDKSINILGPSTPSMSKINGIYTMQIILKYSTIM